MPLPSPKSGESESDFVTRCMSNETVREDFSDQEQRAGVCYSQWRKSKEDSENAAAFVETFINASDEVKAELADIAEKEIDLAKRRKTLLTAVARPVAPTPDRRVVVMEDGRVFNRRSPPSRTPTRTVSARSVSPDVGEITIYSDIGSGGLFGDEFGAKEFSGLLDEIGDVRQIDLRINSYGGDVFEGIAIYNRIRSHPAQFTAYIDGIAASIASVIAMAADEVVMYDTSTMMIHLPWTYTGGNEDELSEAIEQLQLVKQQLVAAYKYKTGKPDEEILEAMRKETWMTAAEAKAAGYADRIEVGGDSKIAASGHRDWIQHGAQASRKQYLAKVSHDIAMARAALDRIETRGQPHAVN